ncbi:MAG: site-specific integrase [Anaerolineaceae bacterium]|nr:MAG: site-specific integrase [Anaerolineaceae bacterium]
MNAEKSKDWVPTKDPRIKKRGEFYWARFQKRNVKVEESLGTRSFEIAKRAVEEIESNIILGVNWQKERELVETAWPEFLADKASGNKTKIAREKTLREYIGFGERWILPHLGGERLTDVTDEAWEKLVEKIRADRPDMLFFNLRKYLMGFLSWAKRKGKIREMPYLFDPDTKTRAAREEAGPGIAYTIEELAAIRKAAEPYPDFYLFVCIAQYMGMRPGEINQLKLDRIDTESGIIALRKADTKTHGARLVPIHPLVMSALKARIQKSVEIGSPYLFPNRVDKERPMDRTGFKKTWYEVIQTSGLNGRMYDFRHSFITHALTAKMNPVVVAEMTGTSLKVIQKHYLHLQPKDLITEVGMLSL